MKTRGFINWGIGIVAMFGLTACGGGGGETKPAETNEERSEEAVEADAEEIIEVATPDTLIMPADCAEADSVAVADSMATTEIPTAGEAAGDSVSVVAAAQTANEEDEDRPMTVEENVAKYGTIYDASKMAYEREWKEGEYPGGWDALRNFIGGKMTDEFGWPQECIDAKAKVILQFAVVEYKDGKIKNPVIQNLRVIPTTNKKVSQETQEQMKNDMRVYMKKILKDPSVKCASPAILKGDTVRMMKKMMLSVAIK